jgi:hypothetical protein
MMLYEDKLIRVGLPDKPAVKGHVIISVRAPFDVLSTDDFAHVLSCATFTSSALFEGAQAQGTNIILTGSRMDVIARQESDGLQLQWDPVTVSPDEMDTLSASIREKCEVIVDAHAVEPRKHVEPSQEVKRTPLVPQKRTEEVKNYLLRKLERLP